MSVLRVCTSSQIKTFVFSGSQQHTLTGGRSRSKSFNKPNICTFRAITSCFLYEIFLHFAILFIDAMIFSLCIMAKCLIKASETKCIKESNNKNCFKLICISSCEFLHLNQTFRLSLLSRPRPESHPVMAFLLVSSPPLHAITSTRRRNSEVIFDPKNLKQKPSHFKSSNSVKSHAGIILMILSTFLLQTGQSDLFLHNFFAQG